MTALTLDKIEIQINRLNNLKNILHISNHKNIKLINELEIILTEYGKMEVISHSQLIDLIDDFLEYVKDNDIPKNEIYLSLNEWADDIIEIL